MSKACVHPHAVGDGKGGAWEQELNAGSLVIYHRMFHLRQHS